MQPLSKITKTISPILNGRFDVVSLTKGQDKDDFLSVKVKYIAVLPFERTADDKIKAIYGLKFENPATDQTDVTIVTDTINPTVDGSYYDSVVRALIEEAGLDIEKAGINEDDIFYIGNISTSLPATAQIKCYAVDFSKISNPESPIEFARTLSKSKFTKDSSEIVKIGFHQVVNGDFSDSLILSGSFLLISYFN
jgi:hypothetical protein